MYHNPYSDMIQGFKTPALLAHQGNWWNANGADRLGKRQQSRLKRAALYLWNRRFSLKSRTG